MSGERKRWPDPAELLDELGIEKPPEIDVRMIAEHCGATVVYQPLHGCEARLVAEGDRAYITVHEDTHHHRKRFSAAHELGHWMLDRHRTAYACTAAMIARGWGTSKGADDQPEIDANRWAADLLMPEHLFAPMVEDSPITLDAARDLTRWFSTSLIATAIRLVRFGSASSMIIWNRPGKRYKWFKRSPYMPASVWPRPQPGPGTVAYRLMRGEHQKPGPQRVRWDEWINLENLQLSYVMEDSMRMRNGDVLTLLEWMDETYLDELFLKTPPGRR